MSMHRKNKSYRPKGVSTSLPWFIINTKRQKRRNKLAKFSRKQNRGK